nr:MAG TPA_asm: hypothetical protein [Caudoviricetes sp.]DAW20403.1 MAG TPA: hypothetical protein [Caudoviricetes sp.]
MFLSTILNMLKNTNGFLFVVNHALVLIFAIFAIIKK